MPVWIITKQCWLANAIRQGPSTEAVAMHFKHAGVKSSHVQVKTIIVTVNAEWVLIKLSCIALHPFFL